MLYLIFHSRHKIGCCRFLALYINVLPWTWNLEQHFLFRCDLSPSNFLVCRKKVLTKKLGDKSYAVRIKGSHPSQKRRRFFVNNFITLPHPTQRPPKFKPMFNNVHKKEDVRKDGWFYRSSWFLSLWILWVPICENLLSFLGKDGLPPNCAEWSFKHCGCKFLCCP